MRTSVGVITLMDIKDGFDPISLVLGNQSHSLAADSYGGVTNAVIDDFECEIYVYIGVDRIPYTSLATQPVETYKVIGVTSTSSNGNWSTSITVVNNQAVIKLANVPNGDSESQRSTNLVVEIDVRNKLGNITTVKPIISINKVIQGAGGSIVSMIPNRQTFSYDENDVTSDGDITISVETEGVTGGMNAFYSRNSQAFAPLVQGTGVNKAKLLDIDGIPSDSIVISSANFGTANTFAIKVTGDPAGVDVVSIVKIQDGKTGPASLTVSITTVDGGQVFKNNQGSAKTLEVDVWDNNNNNLVDPNLITYSWLRDGVGFPVGNPGTSRTLTVGPGDVDNDSSNMFTCTVVTD